MEKHLVNEIENTHNIKKSLLINQPKKSLDEIILYSNVFSLLHIKCDKQNAACMNTLLSTDNKIYLVKKCQHLVCEVCYQKLFELGKSNLSKNVSKGVCESCLDVNNYQQVKFPKKSSSMSMNSEAKKRYSANDDEILEDYYTYLLFINNYKTNSSKFQNCFLHNDRKATYIYNKFSERDDEDTPICDECYVNYDNVSKGTILNIDEALEKFEESSEKSTVKLDREISNTKVRMEKIEKVIKDLITDNNKKKNDYDAFYDKLTKQFNDLYKKKSDNLKEENTNHQGKIKNRIEALETLKLKLNNSSKLISQKVIELISNADYQKENVSKLLDSASNLKNINNDIENEKNSITATEIEITRKKFKIKKNAISEKLMDTYGVTFKQHDINDLIPLN